MRTFWTWALALAVPAVCVTEARPGEPIVPEGTAAKLILLRQKSVQKELKLSPEVTQKVRAFTKKQWEAAEKAWEELGHGTFEAYELPDPKPDDFRHWRTKYTDELL